VEGDVRVGRPVCKILKDKIGNLKIDLGKPALYPLRVSVGREDTTYADKVVK
jgi:hypothetical protein